MKRDRDRDVGKKGKRERAISGWVKGFSCKTPK